MSKGTRNLILGIIAIILLFVIIIIIYQQYRTEPLSANEAKGNILADPNSGLDNMLNKIFGNEETENEENNITNTTNENVQNTNTENKTNDEDLTEDDSRMTPRENKAIKLVQELWKKEWGNLSGVSFNVSIQSDGKYGVTVYNVVTTETIRFYVVDVDTEVVRER